MAGNPLRQAPSSISPSLATAPGVHGWLRGPGGAVYELSRCPTPLPHDRAARCRWGPFRGRRHRKAGVTAHTPPGTPASARAAQTGIARLHDGLTALRQLKLGQDGRHVVGDGLARTPAAIAVGVVNLIGAVIGLVAGSDGAIIGLTVSAIGTALSFAYARVKATRCRRPSDSTTIGFEVRRRIQSACAPSPTDPQSGTCDGLRVRIRTGW